MPGRILVHACPTLLLLVNLGPIYVDRDWVAMGSPVFTVMPCTHALQNPILIVERHGSKQAILCRTYSIVYF